MGCRIILHFEGDLKNLYQQTYMPLYFDNTLNNI